MSPTKNNSRSNKIENIPLSSKPNQDIVKFKKYETTSKSKWKILAQAIRKNADSSAFTNLENASTDLNREKSILRYPSYDLIQCKRTRTNALDLTSEGKSSQTKDNFDRSEENRRVWYNIFTKGYDEISLKVSSMYPLKDQ